MPYRQGNFSYIADTSFNPYQSMQEMLVPFTAYKDAFEKTEAAYDVLNQKAGDMKYFADNLPEGSRAKAIYDNYAQELDKQAKDLAKNGLNTGNRRSLMDLKRRYAGEIGMLEKANVLRVSQMKEQHDLGLKDPTMMFSREAKFSSLDDYLDNPDLTYQNYSGALLAKQVNDAAASIAKSLVDYTNGKPLDGNTRTWLQKHGLTALEVAQAISNPQSMQSSRVLSTLMNSVMESSGITEWADPATLKKAYLYASQGLWKAIGEDKVGTYKLPTGKQAGKVVDQNGNVIIPSLTPKSSQTSVPQNSQQPQNSNTGSKRGRRYTHAFGGHLFVDGGETSTPQKIKVSPQLGYMLDNMDDAAYNAFIAQQAGTSDYTEAQEDSVLQAYDKQLIESMEDNYLRHLENEGYTDIDKVQPEYEPQNVLTSLEATQTAKNIEMMKKYGKYFYRDKKTGTWYMNNAGREFYKNTPYIYRGKFSQNTSNDDEFKLWVDRNQLSEMAKGRPGKYQSGIMDKLMQRVNNKYDANLSTEYYGMLDTDQSNDLMSRLYHVFNNGELPIYKRIKEGDSYVFKDSGDKKDLKDISKHLKGASVVFGKHGNYLQLVLEDGDKYSIPFDQISSLYDPIVTGNVTKAEALKGLQDSGTKVVLKDNGKSVESVEQAKTRALNAALYNMISTFSTWKPKSGEVKRGIYRAKND